MVDISPEADRILVARLHDTAKRHARWRELSEAEHDAAVPELRELGGGRADLLAEVAGVLEGASEGELDEVLVRQASVLGRCPGSAVKVPVAAGRMRNPARMLTTSLVWWNSA